MLFRISDSGNITNIQEPVFHIQKPYCAIFDLDGVLADLGPEGWKHMDWSKTQECEAAMRHHPCNYALMSLLNMVSMSHNVFICTARPSQYEAVTKNWLDMGHISYARLLMRKEGDNRPDAEVKLDMLNEIRQNHEVWFAIDDRNSCVAMYRKAGILCLQNRNGKLNDD